MRIIVLLLLTALSGSIMGALVVTSFQRGELAMYQEKLRAAELDRDNCLNDGEVSND